MKMQTSKTRIFVLAMLLSPFVFPFSLRVDANTWLSEARAIKAQLKSSGKSTRNWRAYMSSEYKRALMRRTFERALRVGPNRLVRTGFVPDFVEGLDYRFQRGFSRRPSHFAPQAEALGLLELRPIPQPHWISFAKEEKVLQMRLDVNRGYSEPAMVRGVVKADHISNLEVALKTADGVSNALASSLAKGIPVENITHFGLFTMREMGVQSQIGALEGIEYISTKVNAFRSPLAKSSRGRQFIDDIQNLSRKLDKVDGENMSFIHSILDKWE